MDKRTISRPQPVKRLGKGDAFRPLQELLDETRCEMRMSIPSLANTAGYNYHKIQTRLADPATLTLAELMDVAGALELHKEDLLPVLEPVWQMLEELD